jgi:hypothetical protein
MKVISGFIVGMILSATMAQAASPLETIQRVTITVAGHFPCEATEVLSKRLVPTPIKGSAGVTRYRFWRCVSVEDVR